MLTDTLQDHWIDAFYQVLDRCRIQPEETVVVLSELHSRDVNVQLTELALTRLGATFFRMVLPAQRSPDGPIVRSTGASLALEGQPGATRALCDADVIVDLTLEGLMHAGQTADILSSGARIMAVSNEHPDVLCRLVPEESMKSRVREAVGRLRASQQMRVQSVAGTDLTVNLVKASTVGVWGWTDRAGTLAHWPGGLVVSFPKADSVNGQLVLAAGDMNLTFKRYIESPVTLVIENDYVRELSGQGADTRLMRDYLKSFDEPQAYATSHVGWGLNPRARYEALTTYDRSQINGTELRAVNGNFLFSTGANEFAGRYTRGHFDLPVMDCTILLDGDVVVDGGVPV